MLKRFDVLAPGAVAETTTVQSEALPLERIEKAKRAFSCRRVQLADMRTLITGQQRPRAGDLVLARVEKLGQHRNLDTRIGRRHLFPGDEIVVCYGNRYAPDQYETEVPADLSACDLVAAGGMASKALNRHDSIKPPTVIKPIGLIADAHGEVLNLSRYGLAAVDHLGATPPAIAVVGTAMNAGKTTTAAHLVRGLAMRGYRVAALKVTGTGSPNDVAFFRDAGAEQVLDFTDAGHASTYRVNAREVERIFATLLAAVSDADVVVIEIADGLFQEETAALLRSPLFHARTEGLIFAAGDAMGAVAGVEWLQRHGLRILGLSGVLSRAPLAIREASQATGLPVYTKDALCSEAASILEFARTALKYGS